MERLKWIFSFLCGCVATFFQHYGIMIILVLVAIGFDVITGLIKAKVTGSGLSSEIGTKGFFKKLALLASLFFGFFLDYFIPIMVVNGIGKEIPFDLPFGMMICIYIVLNEAISICENLYAANPSTMPGWIVKLLMSAKEEVDKKVDDNGNPDEQ